ncbi:unnamed protein product [Gadus morhua 'NCC']
MGAYARWMRRSSPARWERDRWALRRPSAGNTPNQAAGRERGDGRNRKTLGEIEFDTRRGGEEKKRGAKGARESEERTASD